MESRNVNLVIRGLFMLHLMGLSLIFLALQTSEPSPCINLLNTLGAVSYGFIIIVLLPMELQLKPFFYYQESDVQFLWTLTPELFIVTLSWFWSTAFIGMGFATQKTRVFTIVVGSIFLIVSRYLNILWNFIELFIWMFQCISIPDTTANDVKLLIDLMRSQFEEHQIVEYPRFLRNIANICLVFNIAFIFNTFSGNENHWINLFTIITSVFQILVGFPESPHNIEWRFFVVFVTHCCSIYGFCIGHEFSSYVAVLLFLQLVVPLAYVIWKDIKEVYFYVPWIKSSEQNIQVIGSSQV